MYKNKDGNCVTFIKSLTDYEELREDQLANAIFAENFVMAIVGVNIFKKNCCVNNFSDYISKSDEAMAFLILANNWDVWKEMAEDMIKNKTEVKIPMEKCVNKQRYHVDGKGRIFMELVRKRIL